MVRERYTAAYPGSPVTSLRGSGATEQAFRRSFGHPRFIHLATHGFSIPPEAAAKGFRSGDGEDYWTSNPMGLSRIHPGLLSGILMAGANRPARVDRDDGVLTAVEAQHLDLAGTDLVVLSACESAVGTSTRGEGLMGLQRAFQVAGARSLVSSLWSVEDNATAALMDEFYANLWSRRLPRLEAPPGPVDAATPVRPAPAGAPAEDGLTAQVPGSSPPHLLGGIHAERGLAVNRHPQGSARLPPSE